MHCEIATSDLNAPKLDTLIFDKIKHEETEKHNLVGKKSFIATY